MGDATSTIVDDAAEQVHDTQQDIRDTIEMHTPKRQTSWKVSSGPRKARMIVQMTVQLGLTV